MKPMRFLTTCTAAVLLLFAVPRSAIGQEFKRGTYATTFNGIALEVQFTDSGTVTVKANDTIVVIGTFALKGDEIELRDRSGPLACSEDQVGRYKWTLVEKTLTLVLVSDDCQGRTQSIAGQPWTWLEPRAPPALLLRDQRPLTPSTTENTIRSRRIRGCGLTSICS
jgi:hypothetical protein